MPTQKASKYLNMLKLIGEKRIAHDGPQANQPAKAVLQNQPEEANLTQTDQLTLGDIISAVESKVDLENVKHQTTIMAKHIVYCLYREQSQGHYLRLRPLSWKENRTMKSQSKKSTNIYHKSKTTGKRNQSNIFQKRNTPVQM